MSILLENASYLDFFNSWTNAINKENFELAANLDYLFYKEHVRKTENFDMWEKWQKLTFDRRKKITNFFIRKIPNRSYKENNSEIKNLAIVYDQFSGLAHETQLARNIKYLKKNTEAKLNIFIIYAFGSENKEAASRVHENAEGIYFLQANATMQVGFLLSKISDLHSFDVILYGSTFELAFWSSLTCDHNNQKYLIMKYYPSICGRFSSFAGGREDNNKTIVKNNFEYLQLSILDLNIKTNANYALNHIVSKSFGSISRVQKTIHPKYEDMVLRLLSSNATSHYLYTGSENEVDFVDYKIRNHERSIFMGWVDPLIAINHFSIYLDPFPWGGGEMTLLALASGIPYLTLSTIENENVGIYRFLKYLLLKQFHSANYDVLSFIFCSSIDELESKFKKLHDSFGYRFELGVNWQVILENYKPDDLHLWLDFLTN